MQKRICFMLVLCLFLFVGVLLVSQVSNAKPKDLDNDKTVTVTKSGTTIIRSKTAQANTARSTKKRNAQAANVAKKKESKKAVKPKTAVVENAEADTADTPDDPAATTDTGIDTNSIEYNILKAQLANDPSPLTSGEQQPTPDAPATPVATATAPATKGVDQTKEAFPAKSDFIANEDTKAGDKMGEAAVPVSVAQKGLPVADAPVFSAASFSRLLFSVVALSFAAIGLAYLWRYLQKRSFQIFSNNGVGLKILAQQVIGPKSRLVVVEVLGKKFLIGATDTHVQLLSDMDFYESGGAETTEFDVPAAAPVPSSAKSDPAKREQSGTGSVRVSKAAKTPFVPVQSYYVQHAKPKEPVPQATEISAKNGLPGNSAVTNLIREKLRGLKKLG